MHDVTNDPLLDAIFGPDPTDRRQFTPSEAGQRVRERAKARLMEKIENAEELLVGLEHRNATHTEPRLIRTDPRFVRAARTRFWPRWLAHWCRPWLDSAAPDVLGRIADRHKDRGDTERARWWEDAMTAVRTARADVAERAALECRARSSVRALNIARAVEKLAELAPDLRAAALDKADEVADVFLVRLEGLDRLTPPELLPYSEVVDRLPDISSKPTARRRWKTAVKWIAANRPHLRDDLRDILQAA